MIWRRCACGVATLLAVALWSAATSAEIYRWMDSDGRMHFTHDLGQVPANQRPAALEDSKKPSGRDPIQRFDMPAPPARTAPDVMTSAGGSGKKHVIRVGKAGSSMHVTVLLNGHLEVPFIIDTGATDVLVPEWAVEQMGIETSGKGVRTDYYSTANGTIEAAIITLDSVQLGTARVENVAGAVGKGMRYGLLGLSFFNHFDTNIDTSRGIVTLTENSLKQDGVLRGSRSREQWSHEFGALRNRIESVEHYIDEIPFSKTRKRESAEEMLAKLTRDLEILESEADDAKVPFSWRD